MLRLMFGERPRKWEGQSAETVREMEAFIRHVQNALDRKPDGGAKLRKYWIWSEGLLRSFDELEQSRYAAIRFGSQITATSLKEMGEAERLNYDRYVYFDKNAFIRVFSLLDKLGTLLNDALALETEKVKAHFSFFTVLRRMRQDGLHRELGERLGQLKDGHQAALGRLRTRRNMEIHHMNAELQDDLLQSLHSGKGDLYRFRLEDLSAQMEDLEEGWHMIVRTLAISFRYLRFNVR
ncbi:MULTISPECIES: Cthe_2314 family HEPN domain-containing protein [Cohnella]|uniref:Cthe_2314 family HEPN domain-containing protein n=1 Tax=Cohnella TaxID=329857 RepID=UPI000E3B005F|nr:Cthe_2314 family HEPN domain-containing protein [Cohnella sp.]REK60537.1 MAG: hypothetical protein C6P35_18650 [Cohnella sp.]